MARTCVFCGGTGKMSAEHVFPQWSREYLREVEGKGTHTRKILHGDGRISARSHKADPATATVKTVCASCNNGWMSRLESEAMPFLLSMIKGHRRTYYDAGKALIARWTLKTALVSGSAFHVPTPKHFYDDFYRSREPSETTRIWLAATNRKNFHTVDYRPLKISPADGPPVPTENAFAALLSLGFLGFYVIGWRERIPDFDTLRPFDDALVPLWPTEGPTTWPPRRRLDEGGLDQLADALASWGKTAAP